MESSAALLRSAPVFSLNYSVVQYNDLKGQKTTQSGKLIFDHQGHFQLSSPAIAISLDDAEYREYRISAKQMMVKKAVAANVLSPAQMLYKYLECPVLSESKEGSLIKLKLNPKGKFREAQSLFVWLNPKTFAPSKVNYTDAGNNSYTYSISALKSLPAMKASQFRINPKAGTETIDLR